MTDPSTEVVATPVIWKRNLLVLAGSQLLAVSAMSIVLPMIPFFVRELGTTDRAAVERWSGLIFSGPFLAAALMSPVWGHLGDRYGHKKMVVRAVLGLAAVNFLLVFVESPLQFWIIRLVQGMVTGFIPAAMAITSASTPPDKLPEAMGKLAASASAGRLIGPALGGVLAGFMAFRNIFLLTGAIISVAAVLVILLLEDSPRTSAKQKTSAAGNLRYVLGEPRLRMALLGLLVAMAGVSMAMPIFPLYVEDLLGGGEAKVITGIGFAVVAAFTLLTSAFLGRIADRVGLKAILVSGLSMTAGVLWLHTVVTGVPSMLVVRALLGVGLAGVGTVLHTMISRAAPDGMRGGVTGFASSATIFGFFLGPFFGGWLANHLGVSGVFQVAAAITASCAIGAAIVARRVGRDRVIVPVAESVPR